MYFFPISSTESTAVRLPYQQATESQRAQALAYL